MPRDFRPLAEFILSNAEGLGATFEDNYLGRLPLGLVFLVKELQM